MRVLGFLLVLFTSAAISWGRGADAGPQGNDHVIRAASFTIQSAPPELREFIGRIHPSSRQMIDHTCGALIDACIVGVPAAQKRAVVADLYRQARAGVKQAEIVRRFEDAISKMEYTPSKDRFDALADIVADMNASITRQLNGGINAYRLTIKGKVELPDARFGEFLRGSMSTAIDRLARAGALLVYLDGEIVLTNELESLVPGWDLPAPKMTWECL